MHFMIVEQAIIELESLYSLGQRLDYCGESTGEGKLRQFTHVHRAIAGLEHLRSHCTQRLIGHQVEA